MCVLVPLSTNRRAHYRTKFACTTTWLFVRGYCTLQARRLGPLAASGFDECMCSPKHTALVSVQHLRDHHKSGNPRLVAGSPRARSCAARASVARDTHTDASTHASGVHARNPRLLRRPRLEQAHTTGPRLVLAAKAATRARALLESRSVQSLHHSGSKTRVVRRPAMEPKACAAYRRWRNAPPRR